MSRPPMSTSRSTKFAVKQIVCACCVYSAMFASELTVHAQSKPTVVAVPEDSPVFAAFKALEQQPAYRMTFNMQVNDPRMAQAAAHGFAMGATETVVKDGVHQSTMHMKMPAFDKPGAADDWQIIAVVKNGRGARIFKSDAIPRLQKLNDQMLAMQLAMMEKQAAMTIAQAAAQGPYGAIQAGMTAAQTVAFSAMAIREEKKAKEFWGWKCLDKVGSAENADRAKNPLTDLTVVGDDTVSGVPVTVYEFFVKENDQIHGPMRLSVNKSTNLPLRIDMKDPQMPGKMQMDYSYDNIGDIEIPPCLAK